MVDHIQTSDGVNLVCFWADKAGDRWLAILDEWMYDRIGVRWLRIPADVMRVKAEVDDYRFCLFFVL